MLIEEEALRAQIAHEMVKAEAVCEHELKLALANTSPLARQFFSKYSDHFAPVFDAYGRACMEAGVRIITNAIHSSAKP